MRNMAIYQEDPNKFVRMFSEEFEDDFIRLFRNQGGRRVRANVVYRQYIKDREHFHMNSTMWETLTAFCVYLGKEGKAEVDYAEGKVYIKYIDRDPAVIARQKKVERVLKLEAKDRMRSEQRAEEQRKRAMESAKPAAPKAAPKELVRENGETLAFAMKRSTLQKSREESRKRGRHVFEDPLEMNAEGPPGKKSKVSKLEVLRKQLEHDKNAKKTKNPTLSAGAKDKHDPKSLIMRTKWLTPGIWAKVIKKGFPYHKQKGEIVKLEGHYGCILKMKKDGKKIQIDQSFLETVMPANGRKVKILYGKDIGKIGTLEKLCAKTLKGSLNLDGRIVKLPFEWYSKLAK